MERVLRELTHQSGAPVNFNIHTPDEFPDHLRDKYPWARSGLQHPGVAGQPTESLPRPALPGAALRAQNEQARRVHIADDDDLLDLNDDAHAAPMQSSPFRGDRQPGTDVPGNYGDQYARMESRQPLHHHPCGLTVTTQHGPAAHLGTGVNYTGTPPMPPTWVQEQQPSPFMDDPRTPGAARP